MVNEVDIGCPAHGERKAYRAPVGYIPERSCTCPVIYYKAPKALSVPQNPLRSIADIAADLDTLATKIHRVAEEDRETSWCYDYAGEVLALVADLKRLAG